MLYYYAWSKTQNEESIGSSQLLVVSRRQRDFSLPSLVQRTHQMSTAEKYGRKVRQKSTAEKYGRKVRQKSTAEKYGRKVCQQSSARAQEHKIE